jgi:DNA repair photolyase
MTQLYNVLPNMAFHLRTTSSSVSASETRSSILRLRMMLKFLNTCVDKCYYCYCVCLCVAADLAW